MKKAKFTKGIDYDSDEEKEFLEDYEKGKFVPTSNQTEWRKKLRQAATNYRKKKEARINIRLPEIDLAELKAKAEEEGMPYQTLIASVLHKFVKGRLTNKEA
jgi:predicted DNA binding CopG/RHH family protein